MKPSTFAWELDPLSQTTGEETLFSRLKCSICHVEIIEFRYTCVQCSDYDMCGACTTNGEHRQHYVLRVPQQSPNAETEAVLDTIRQHLINTLHPQSTYYLDPGISVKPENDVEQTDITIEEHILDDIPYNTSLPTDSTIMPRKKNIKQPGLRKYGTITNYTPEMLEEAMNKIRSGVLSQRKACNMYKIPKSTINLKLKNKHNKPVGRPTCLTVDEEIIIRDHLLALSDMGISIGLQDLRYVIKKYLDNIGKTVPVFNDNTPGYGWAKLYMDRHTTIKKKIAHKFSSIQVNEDMVNKFFDRLEKEIQDVSPDNIYNMDESGFHDDPEKRNLLFRRSTRYPEQVKTSIMSCYTIVFAGNASGHFIPPFFIFKEKHCSSDWLVNAPKSSRIAVSKSGWIDADIFEEWLEKHFVPIVKKKEGKKILICNYLSAHISVKALKICEEHNIKFICLIPNSTHLLQPLSIGYFSSLDSAWRTVLNKWHQTRDRKAGSMPKNVFCELINSALQLNKYTAGNNMIAGFRKCGIFPCSRTEVLKVLPSCATGQIQATVAETFKEYLQKIRASDLNIISTKTFQLPVKAGKSITAEEVEKFYKNRQEETQQEEIKNLIKNGSPEGSKNKRMTTNTRVIIEEEIETGEKAEAKITSDHHELDCENSDTESYILVVATAQVNNEPNNLHLELEKIEECIVSNIPIPENEVEVTNYYNADFDQEYQQIIQKNSREHRNKEKNCNVKNKTANNNVKNQEAESKKDKKDHRTYKIQQNKRAKSFKTSIHATKKPKIHEN